MIRAQKKAPSKVQTTTRTSGGSLGRVYFVDEKRKALSKNLPSEASVAIKKDFKGKFKESFFVYTSEGVRNLLVGVGKAEFTAHECRCLGALIVQNFQKLGLSGKVEIAVPSVKKVSASEISENLTMGAKLSQFRLEGYKTRSAEEMERLQSIDFNFVSEDKRDARALLDGQARGALIAEGVNWARDLIMRPGREIYPETLADYARKMVASSPSKANIRLEVWNEKEIEKHKFGGLLGVAQGSDRPPRFLILEYRGTAKSEAPIVLVGKGITFDSGGLSLKPPQGQEHMKYDMAGSASVLATFKIITDLKVKVNLVVLVPAAENMPSGKATRPGDILRMASGKTVEVLNTDAEGRLILADALYWASTQYKPRAIIDVATLTGACAAAVGEAAAGVFSNREKLRTKLVELGREVREYLWPLPDFDEFYAGLLNTDVADLKNIGGREAGASTASIFLRHFVENNVPWAHLDIAGCGWYDAPRDFISVKGSSGVPIRLLTAFVESAAKAKF